MSGGDKTSPSLTIDRAAFLLLRVKKAFKKKKQQRCKDKSAAGAGAVEGGGKQDNRGSSRNASGKPAPLLRSRTLPAIVAPGLNILQAQIDARYAQEQEDATIVGDELALLIPPYLGTCTTTNTKRNSTAKAAAAGLLAGGKQLLAPRISFTDDQLERRVSDTGPNYRRGRAAGDAAGGTTGGSNKDHPHSYRGSSLSAGSGGSSSQPLSRLAARLLNQRPSFIAASTASAAVIPSDELPRRLSWERRKCSNASTSIGGLASSSCLARSSSIDSVAECWSLLGDQHYQQLCEQQQHKLPKRSPSPLLGATSRLDSRLASVASSSSSSSATPRASRPKGHRALIGGGSSSTSPGTSSTTSLSPAARAGKVPDDSSALLSAMVPKDLDSAVRLERVTPRDIAEDLEAKLHIGPAKTASKLLKIDELSIKNSTFSAYENPTFVDSSFDSSVSSFFYEDDESDQSQEEKGFEKIVHEKNAKMKQQRERQWKEQPDTLTVVYENGQDRCNSHRNCCTRTNAKVSGKKNFFGFGSEVRHTAVCKKTTCKENLHHNEQQASQFSKFYVDSKSGSCEKINDCVRKHEALNHKRKGGAKKNLKLLGLDFAAVGTKQRISLEHTSEKKLHSLRGMEFLEGFGKKKQQLQRNRQCQINNNLSAVHVNPLAAQSSLNIHLHALFAAVENGNLDKARAILESTDVDINSVNSDGLSPLDVSVLSNNRSLSKMLVSFGAQEGNQFTSADSLGSHLALLLSEAEHRVQELSGGSSGEAVGFPSSSLGPSLALGAESTGAVQQFQPPHLSSGMPPPPPPPMSHRSSFSSQHNLTGCGGTAEDKQLALWERRARALRKMLYGFDQARPPDVPFLVTVDVTGVTSVTARFQESELCESFICTKFKIQWSTKEDFSTILGERELLDVKEKECSINNLIHGQKYYFRAAAGNIKGYSRFRPTTPAFLTPSSWRDVDSRINRFSGRLEQIDSLMVNIRGAEYSQETPALQRRNHKKKTTIKQLFTATSKFQKNLRRGVYLACLLYHEDKILVTNEDFLPVIEVDETYPSCIQNDYNWLIKVASTWDDLKSLKQDMEKCHSSSSQHFRIKLLQAAIQMQTAFGIQDLGQLFHKPIRDIQGTLVFSVINSVKSPKSVSMLNSRWLSVAKVTKKIVTHEDSNVADILMASIQSQINYHQVSSIKLNGGLYIGYLKMQSSVDSIQVVVPTKSPNFLPHCKIRDNSHVSAEEWECLKRVARMNPDNSQNREVEEKSEDEEKENLSYEFVGTEQQKVFIDQVAIAAKQLFSYMDINTNESHLHRIYDMEVIDLNDEVSFLVAVPPAETACSVPGTREILLQRSDLLSLPIQVFEMVHLNTYQKELINRYSRLSLLLELDTAQAQHSHREAFSNLELTVAKDKLTRLQDLQTQMNSVWKGARWLVDLITFARDRGTSSTSGGINIKNLLSLERNRSRSNSNNTNGNVNTLKRSLLQLPPRDPKLVKASPGRGSWPGPSVTNSNESSQINLLSQELSKSEQQLPLGSYSRKGSNSSNCSSVSEPYKSTWLKTSGVSNKLSSVSQQLYQTSQTKLPPSRSEDTLLVGKYKQHQQQPLVSRSSASSATTSPLLGMKLSVKSGINSASESAHSVSSEECPALSRSKLAKPTASVAAIADKSNSSELSTSDEFSGSQTLLPGILQVYAAYETGLASGTSLKLHVTGRTTAREVVDLVVKQLNMAVVLKGLEGPVYAQEELQNFCLVAVIGARERCLRDDFKPLQLQNPWKKGRLYVRQKQDVLAALEHSSKHTAYL